MQTPILDEHHQALWTAAQKALEDKNPELALRYLSQARIQPLPLYWLLTQADLLLLLGDISQAITLYQSGITAVQDVRLHHNLALAYEHNQEYESAQAHFQKALELSTQSEETYLILKNRATTYKKMGKNKAALSALEAALEHKFDPDLLLEMGRYLLAIQHFSGTVQTLGNFSSYLNPKWHPQALTEVYLLLAKAHLESGDFAKAKSAYLTATQLSPTPEVQWAQRLAIPIFFDSENAITDFLDTWRKELEQAIGPLTNPLNPHLFPPFYLSYLGGHRDRADLELLSRQFKRSLPRAPELSPHAPHAKPRLGIASQGFRDHSVMRLYSALFQALAQEFDVYIYGLGYGPEDENWKSLSNYASEVKRLIPPLEDMLTQCLEDQLDILLYPDLGGDIYSYVLGHYRLAPLQCALTGILQTSGIATQDVYLASEILIPDPQDFTEDVFLAISPIATQLKKPAMPAPKTRQDFELDPKLVYYLLAVNPIKLHPQMDKVLAELLQKDPHSRLLILQDPQLPINQKIAERLKPRLKDQLLIRPWLPVAEFLGLMQVVDVLLDSFPVGGGVTLVQSIAMNLPAVSWVQPHIKGRGLATLYHGGDLEDCLASSAEDYIQKAYQLCHDQPLNQRVRNSLRAHEKRVFDNPNYATELIQYLKSRLPNLFS